MTSIVMKKNTESIDLKFFNLPTSLKVKNQRVLISVSYLLTTVVPQFTAGLKSNIAINSMLHSKLGIDKFVIMIIIMYKRR